MTQTITCRHCNGKGRKYDPTNADKIISPEHRERLERCGRCQGTGQTAPEAPRKVFPASVAGVDYVPVPDDFWDTWGV